MWKLAPLIVLIYGMITLASACDGGEQASPNAATTGRIAFTSGRDGNDEVYVMNADGSDQEGEICVMTADGSGQTRLTDNPAWDRNPAWSPKP